MDTIYDVVVVGGGAAGMSGAKILARMRRRVLVVDAGAPRNAPAGGVHNYLYAEGTAPAALAARGRDEARAYDVDIMIGAAAGARPLVEPAPGAARFSVDVRAGDGSVSTVGARRVLLATGLVDVLPDVEGLKQRWGLDVLHCPFCHGWEVRGGALGVLGTGAMAVHQVLLFRQLSDDVVYFQHTAPDPTEQQREQLAALEVQHVVGQVAGVEITGGVLSGVRMADGRVIARSALGIGTFLAAREDLLADLGLELADLEMGGSVVGSHLPCDASGATATPGVWAAGNVAAPMAQVINSAAAGAAAGSAILMDLLTEDVEVAVEARRSRQSGTVSGLQGPATQGRAGEYWDHRQARMVRPMGHVVSGGRSPGALAAAERAAAAEDAEAFWEPHYAAMIVDTDGALPGANEVLVDFAGALEPGTALDLGSGHGGDAFWLARRGWEVTSVDVSATALQRVAVRAAEAELSERVRTEQHDLSVSFPTGSFDLVTAQYFQSPVAMDRAAVLARAAAAVRAGGTLLIVDHASVAPWSWADPDSVFPTPEQTLNELRLDLVDWEVAICENRDREANGPGAQRATVTETIIALVRRSAGRL